MGFFFFFFFWRGFFGGLVEEKEKGKKRKKEKRKEEEGNRYGRTLVVACLTHPTKKKNQFHFFSTVGRYLLYIVSSYTYTHFFFPFFKFLLVHFW